MALSQNRRRRNDSARRTRDFRQFLSMAWVFARVMMYSAVLVLAFYLFALALFLLAPTEAKADVVGGDPSGSSQVYDASLGGGSGIMPVGLSEDSATYVTVSRLESADLALDGTLVTFRGEAVGEPVNSSVAGSKWVLVQSTGATTSSIEVLMTDDQVAQIENWGAYRTRGSSVRVTGIYRVADPNNTGNLDVTAYIVTVMDEGGHTAEDPPDMKLVWLGLGFTAVGAVATAVNFYLRKRSRS